MIQLYLFFVLIIYKIIDIIYDKDNDANANPNANTNANKDSDATNKCINKYQLDFIISWVKYTIDMQDCSKAIIANSNISSTYNNLEKSFNELISLFAKLYDNQYVIRLKDLINEQIFVKINLCIATKNNSQDLIKTYIEYLSDNICQLTNLFNEIRLDKLNTGIKSGLQSHSNLYIKSIHTIKPIVNDEINRKIIIGSMETIKLLFV